MFRSSTETPLLTTSSCIGGVGFFLIETGLEVSRGLKEEGFHYDLFTIKLFFESPHAVLLWTIPLLLAIVLRVLTHLYHHQLIFPAYFFIIPIIFYIVVAFDRLDMTYLRENGWIFDVGQNTQAWWKFYTYFVSDCPPTLREGLIGTEGFQTHELESILASYADAVRPRLLRHTACPPKCKSPKHSIIPIDAFQVPALGVSLQEDNVKLDRELVAHGVSNLAAGLTVTVSAHRSPTITCADPVTGA